METTKDILWTLDWNKRLQIVKTCSYTRCIKHWHSAMAFSSSCQWWFGSIVAGQQKYDILGCN